MPEVVAVGEALVEIMRPLPGLGLGQVGAEFRGPFASGAPAIFADQVARLGHTVAFVGAVGQDAFGDVIRSRLRDDEVDISLLRSVPGIATGVAFVAYATDGSRTFIFHIGNSAAGQLPEVPREVLQGARFLHICGSTLAASDRMRDVCVRAAQTARELGVKVCFDPNLRPELLPGGDAHFRDLCAPILELASVIMPGVAELRILTAAEGEQSGAQSLLERGAELVAVKRGAEGCALYRGTECVEVEGFKVEAVDPTGAGDCFDAGVVCGLLEELSLRDIGLLANACGALAATELGPMEGAKFRSEVDCLIREGAARA